MDTVIGNGLEYSTLKYTQEMNLNSSVYLHFVGYRGCHYFKQRISKSKHTNPSLQSS